MIFRYVLFFLFSSVAYSQDCPFCGSLELNVTHIRNDSGVIRVVLSSDEKSFAETDPEKIDLQKIHFKNQKIQKGTARVVFPSLKSGTYAFKIFHDENGNEILDTSLIGKPLEGIAVSGYKEITNENLVFSKASFKLAPKQKLKVTLSPKYFITFARKP